TTNLPTYQGFIVYAYPENGFIPEKAFEGKGPSGLRFADAVTSSGIDENGNYHLSFLPAGTYEIVLAAFKDEDTDGRLEPMGHAKIIKEESIINLEKGEDKIKDLSSSEVILFNKPNS
ncbi:MAG: hypothetical protein R2784_16430, partial [Saprospiraceae bacterium]